MDCLRVENNTAYVSGYVANSNDDLRPPGTPIWFKAVDNGEGQNSAADQLSLVYFVALDCTQDFGPPLFDIGGGNIQVR